MKKKIGIVSLGCPKNLVDSEIMLGLLKGENYEITPTVEEANVIIVNTCGFIESAKKESIETILEMAGYKEDKCEILIVTGCLAQRYKEDIVKEIPEVDAVVGTGSYDRIAQVINDLYGCQDTVIKNSPVFCEDNLRVDYLNNERVISTNTGYAYLKIAEGCNNCCTYCIIPKLRGPYRSRPMEDILREAEYLAQKGVKEVILVAQDVTRYGEDLYKEKKLVDLVRKISRIRGIEAIRLLYCYPEEIDDNLINEIAENPKVLKYIDIPIQHASDRILALMGRRGTKKQIDELLTKLRSRIPEIIIRTSLIVGFPGENEEDFKILYNFVARHSFDRLGVFTYSKEEDTPAYKMKPQIKAAVKRSRYNEIMLLQNKIANKKNKMRLGRVYKVLVEGVADDGIFYYGRSYAEAPEIDGVIYFTSQEPLTTGEYVYIKILNTDDYDLIGEVIDESAK